MNQQVKAEVYKQIDQARKLLAVSKQLRQGLLDRNPDLIAELVREKEKILTDIRQTDNELNKFKNQNQFNKEDYIEETNNIKAIIEECKNINYANLTLIKINMKSISRLKDSLTQARSTMGVLYNKKGEKKAILESEKKGMEI